MRAQTTPLSLKKQRTGMNQLVVLKRPSDVFEVVTYGCKYNDSVIKKQVPEYLILLYASACENGARQQSPVPTVHIRRNR